MPLVSMKPNMNNPILGIDTWEGQLEIDEAVLKANNVAFLFIRLNDMNGGHHKDLGFDKQWAEAQNFYRAPYFVYNPWVSGSANFFWLQDNMPADAKAVAFDIEVSMGGYSPVTYASEVKKFIELCKPKWNFVIYTGEWFMSYLSSWETKADYWWAAYPNEFHPLNDWILTWDELRAALVKYNAPGNVADIPGRLRFWQFSGDRLILPGNQREMDVNVFFGTMAELTAFFGIPSLPPPPLPEPIDIHLKPYPGVDYYEVNRFGVKIYLFLIDMHGKRAEVVYAPYLMTVSQAALLRGAQIAVNGHAWAWRNTAPYGPDDLEGLLMSDGEIIVNHRSGAPFINFTKDNRISMPWNDYSNLYNAVSGFRYLVVDGLKQAYLDDPTKIDNKERHARSAKGIHQDGRLMLLVADGLPDMSYGLLLTQLADVWIEFGARVAMDNDSGGSAALWLKDHIVNQPSDGHERAVVSHLLIYIGDQDMEKYTVISTTNNMKLRTDHLVTLVDNSIETIPMNTPMEADTLYIFPASSMAGATPAFMKGDIWAHVVSVNGVPKNGWVAIIHLAKPYCTYKENAVMPPTAPASVFITHTFADELAITKPDGTVQFYNANFTVPNVEYKPKP